MISKILNTVGLIIGVGLLLLGTDRVFNYKKAFADSVVEYFDSCVNVGTYSVDKCSLIANSMMQQQLLDNVWFLLLALAVPVFFFIATTVYRK